MKNILITLSVILFVACNAKLLPVAQSDVEHGASKFPGLTLQELEQGKADFQKYCTQCHFRKSASAKDEAGWRKTVPIMAGRAAKKPEKQKIDEKTQESILKYLITMTKK